MSNLIYESHRAADKKEWREARKLFKSKKLPPTARLISAQVRVKDEVIEVFWRSKLKSGTISTQPKKAAPMQINQIKRPLYLDDLNAFIKFMEIGEK